MNGRTIVRSSNSLVSGSPKLEFDTFFLFSTHVDLFFLCKNVYINESSIQVLVDKINQAIHIFFNKDKRWQWHESPAWDPVFEGFNHNHPNYSHNIHATVPPHPGQCPVMQLLLAIR
jgi:uncharacterized Zn-finger protein